MGFDWFNVVPEPANKVTYVNFRHFFYKISEPRQGRKIFPSYYLLEKNIITIPYFVMFSRSSPYTEALKEKIDPMLANGLIQKWHEETYAKSSESFVDARKPQVLTLESLRFGYFAYLIGLAFSFSVFLLEVVVGYRKRAKKWLFSALTRCLSKSLNYVESRTQIQPP